MIDLNLSADQRGILAAVGALLTERAPVARLRGPAAAGADAALLPALAEIGVFGLGCPESVGGAGFSLLEDGLVAIELGRHLVTPHALAAPLGARVALAFGQIGLAAEIIGGTCRVCLGQPLASGINTRCSATGQVRNLAVNAAPVTSIVWIKIDANRYTSSTS